MEFSRNIATGYGGVIFSNGDQQRPMQSMKGSSNGCDWTLCFIGKKGRFFH